MHNNLCNVYVNILLLFQAQRAHPQITQTCTIIKLVVLNNFLIFRHVKPYIFIFLNSVIICQNTLDLAVC